MVDKLRLLLVEDNPDNANTILKEIEMSGEFQVESRVVFDRAHFILLLCNEEWDIIVCTYHYQDVMAKDIVEVLDEFASAIPVIVISETQISHIVPVIKRELMAIKNHEELVHSWGKAVEIKDANTSGHTIRVTKMAVDLAKEMKLCWPDIINIKLGAYLHDVGKIMIPDHILLKKGKLTKNETKQMQGHPAYAYQILRSIPFLKKAIEIPYCHHEHWDGSGYPRGLSGLDIPLSARIFSVVDGFDAMTSTRPYRGPLSIEFTLTFIYMNANQLYDPGVVTTFIDMMKLRVD